MRLTPKYNGFGGGHRQPEAGFVGGLWEGLIAFVIVAMGFGSIVGGYMSGATKAQWSGYSLAAQTLAGQTLEQARSAKFDCSSTNGMEITNMTLFSKSLVVTSTNWTMTGYNTNILDVPWTSTNYVVATNFISIRLLFANGITNPWIQMQMIRVDTVWPFNGWGGF